MRAPFEFFTKKGELSGGHFFTFLVIRSRENFENEIKFYAIDKIIDMKLWAKGMHLFLFSCKQ